MTPCPLAGSVKRLAPHPGDGLPNRLWGVAASHQPPIPSWYFPRARLCRASSCIPGSLVKHAAAHARRQVKLDRRAVRKDHFELAIYRDRKARDGVARRAYGLLRRRNGFARGPCPVHPVGQKHRQAPELRPAFAKDNPRPAFG